MEASTSATGAQACRGATSAHPCPQSSARLLCQTTRFKGSKIPLDRERQQAEVSGLSWRASGSPQIKTFCGLSAQPQRPRQRQCAAEHNIRLACQDMVKQSILATQAITQASRASRAALTSSPSSSYSSPSGTSAGSSPSSSPCVSRARA